MPEQLRGRVNSVHYTFAIGGFALGSLLGAPGRDFSRVAPAGAYLSALRAVAVMVINSRREVSYPK
jgi:hypothetical protein